MARERNFNSGRVPLTVAPQRTRRHGLLSGETGRRIWLRTPGCYNSYMGPETKHFGEIMPEHLTGFAETFLSRFDFYPLQRPTGRYRKVLRPLTTELVTGHLRGELTIGAYALSPESFAKWICLDADAPSQWDELRGLAQDLAGQEVPSYLELSRRGGHLWFFLSPISGREARRFGRQLLAEYGISQVELYPKQDQLVTGPGSVVRLPLGKHQRTGQRYHFVTFSGEPLAPTIRAQLAILAAPARVPAAFVTELLGRSPA